ncbi:MAG: hypothetical protein HQ536_04140 [Parcubacteria group bacterium]|nr:hypothetical protein [Parcubacteria group bacterium]
MKKKTAEVLVYYPFPVADDSPTRTVEVSAIKLTYFNEDIEIKSAPLSRLIKECRIIPVTTSEKTALLIHFGDDRPPELLPKNIPKAPEGKVIVVCCGKDGVYRKTKSFIVKEDGRVSIDFGLSQEEKAKHRAMLEHGIYG